jgi:hypothetical protein
LEYNLKEFSEEYDITSTYSYLYNDKEYIIDSDSCSTHDESKEVLKTYLWFLEIIEYEED